MGDEDHKELARLLHRVKGNAAISGYRCDLMDSLYKILNGMMPLRGFAIRLKNLVKKRCG